VLYLGLISSLFEGGMYTFVFIWVPVLQQLAPPGTFPTGLVFSCFMMCVSLGGSLFSLLITRFKVGTVCVGMFCVAGLAMMFPARSGSFGSVFFAFLLFEVCCGVFYPSMALQRSQLLPASVMSTIMNLFRVPLNVLVVAGSRLGSTCSPSTVFAVCAGWYFLAAGLQWSLAKSEVGKAKAKTL